MKFQPDVPHAQSITAYGADWMEINGQRFSSSIIISAMGDRIEWSCRKFEDLQANDFERIAALNPELVIFGSGSSIRFPQPIWLETLFAKRIGLDTMDTHAACRAYNFLAAEGRKVVAALLL
jgi:uncharacterized protein